MSTDTPDTPGNPEEQATTSPSPAEGKAGRKAQARPGKAAEGENLSERAREVQERLEEGYHELERRYDDARVQLRNANDTAVHFIRENPALCIVGAVGVGYFIGRLASRRWLT